MSLLETKVFTHPEMVLHKHEWNPTAQESPLRLSSSVQRCEELGLFSLCNKIEADDKERLNYMESSHDLDYVKLLKSTDIDDPDLHCNISSQYDGVFFNKHTWKCTVLSCNCSLQAVEEVLNGTCQNAFCIARPPGHHAMKAEACGYCFLNNVAIAAEYALREFSPVCKRVLIVDYDVHHGQGTQYQFYDDPNVLYISIHRYEQGKFWPKLRESDYDFIGNGPGRGYNVNIPLNETGCTDVDYLYIFYSIILPLAHEFCPDLVLVSSGFDAAMGCPEGRMWLSPAVYGHFVHQLKSLANGRLIVVLEGGYCIDSLKEGVAHTLLGLICTPPVMFANNSDQVKASVKETVLNCWRALRPYWRVLKDQKGDNAPDTSQLPTNTWLEKREIAWPLDPDPFYTAEELQRLGFSNLVKFQLTPSMCQEHVHSKVLAYLPEQLIANWTHSWPERVHLQPLQDVSVIGTALTSFLSTRIQTSALWLSGEMKKPDLESILNAIDGSESSFLIMAGGCLGNSVGEQIQDHFKVSDRHQRRFFQIQLRAAKLDREITLIGGCCHNNLPEEKQQQIINETVTEEAKDEDDVTVVLGKFLMNVMPHVMHSAFEQMTVFADVSCSEDVLLKNAIHYLRASAKRICFVATCADEMNYLQSVNTTHLVNELFPLI